MIRSYWITCASVRLSAGQQVAGRQWVACRQATRLGDAHCGEMFFSKSSSTSGVWSQKAALQEVLEGRLAAFFRAGAALWFHCHCRFKFHSFISFHCFAFHACNIDSLAQPPVCQEGCASLMAFPQNGGISSTGKLLVLARNESNFWKQRDSWGVRW